MTKIRSDLVQAVPLIDGQVNVGVGTYKAKGLIHAEEDAVITLDFSTPLDYTMLAGADRGYIGSFTVLSGTVTYE